MDASSLTVSATPPTLVAQRSRHRIRPFRLHRPETAEEAVIRRAESVGASAYLAGGIDIIATLKMGAVITDVIHLRSLPAWTSIAEREDAIAIAAGVTHRDFADSRLLRRFYPDLCASWSGLANSRIRIKGTLAGNLMARNPAYDFAMVAVAASARLEYLNSDRISSQVPADRLLDIPSAALLTHIVMPRVPWLAFVVQCQWKPIVSFALSFRRVQGPVIGRLAVGSGYQAVSCSEMRLEHDLFDRSGRETAADITERLCNGLPEPTSDWRASAEYRRHLLNVLVGREIERIRARGPCYEH
jgi:CO/xanthine dehydrogenase FAD-binding subunit